MKHLRCVTGSFVSMALLILAIPTLWAQDMVKVAPKNCKLLLDNERVRVVRVVLKPGDKLEMHSHPATIVYSLTSGKVKYIMPDGKTEEREIKAGTTRWSESETHSTENTGTTESRALVIELKK